MQTVIQVVCKKPSNSLRDAIINDKKLGDDEFQVKEAMRPGRSPGWTKITSTATGRQGSINIQWIDSTNMLICRVINKGDGKPNLIVGDFVDYLLRRHGRRLKFIMILPE
jgi:hypothetical protein